MTIHIMICNVLFLFIFIFIQNIYGLYESSHKKRTYNVPVKFIEQTKQINIKHSIGISIIKTKS